MRIERIRLRKIAMPLKSPFVSATGVETTRRLLIVEATAAGLTGYGEVSALATPYYTEETYATAHLMLESFIIPIALEAEWETPSELAGKLRHIRRHFAAKAGLEAAAWDLYAQARGLPLHALVGGTQHQIPAGVAIGLERDLDSLCHIVDQRLREGYRRIKVKIAPGWDAEPLRAIRQSFGDIVLMADANSSYTLNDIEALRRLDDLNLLMIEQPLADDDLIDHAKLQHQLRTPVCLDESIHSLHHAKQAIELGSCQIINVKLSRVGGLSEAMRIHDFCYQHGIPLWCGGMLESGIGRAHNIALASLPGFTLPGDISASARYWERDVIQPEVTVSNEGYIDVPQAIGLGYAVDEETLEDYTVWTETYEGSF